MSFLDGFLGQLTGGSVDIPTLAQMVDLSPEQVESAVIALAQSSAREGDRVQFAAEQTGLPGDKLSAIVRNIGGEGVLPHIRSFLGGGETAGDSALPDPKGQEYSESLK